MPKPTPTRRTNLYERRVWRVSAQITEFKLEADDDIHLVLFGKSHYMIAEMPSPACLPRKTRDRRAIVAVRKRFVSRCGTPDNSWRSLGATVFNRNGRSSIGVSSFRPAGRRAATRENRRPGGAPSVRALAAGERRRRHRRSRDPGSRRRSVGGGAAWA